jgi:DNA replication protein DnaC
MEKVPAKYRQARLPVPYSSDCFMSAEKHAKVQSGLLELLEKDQHQSLIIYGPPGFGKTTYMAAVFAEAAKRQTIERELAQGVTTKLYWFDLGVWQQEAAGHQFGRRVTPPEVTVEVLQKNRQFGYTPCLFIDEFDKVSDKEHLIQYVNPLMRAAYDNRCRLVITTNLTRDEFSQRFDAHINRRIEERCIPVELE